MDMKINAHKIRQIRQERAWSQEHLAHASGLGLRTIQRIEAEGSASLESIKALAAVFELSIEELQAHDQQSPTTRVIAFLNHNRREVLVGLMVLAAVFSPPDIVKAAAVAFVLWMTFECLLCAGIRTGRRFRH